MNAIENYLGQKIPEGWESVPVEVDGAHYGDVMLSGSEIHIALFPEYRRRVRSRRVIHDTLRPLLAARKFLTTRSHVGDETEPFIKRLGFVQTNEDEQFRYWWLDSLPFERKHHGA
jgi:hypothetical protein